MKKLLALFALTLSVAFAQDLNGAGATFPDPLYQKMFSVYNQDFGIQVNYQAIGSGGGRSALLDQTVDFAGTDAYFSDEELSSAPGQILHIPMASGAVVLAYNFEPLAQAPEGGLVLDGPTVADIFLGNITQWNDDAISNLNPNAELPDLPITVAHRSDGSGTTSIFVDYLAKVSEQWASDVSTGPESSVNWPVGIGGDGNPGVSSIVADTPGAIGYVGLEYAEANDLAYTNMVNAAGNTVQPTLDAVAAAADIELPDDLRATFTNSDAPDAWPIAGFTWITLYEDQNYAGRSQEQAQSTVNLISWMLTEGQQYNNPLNYGQITGGVQSRAEEILGTVTYGGQALTPAAPSPGN